VTEIAHADLMQLPVLSYTGPVHVIRQDADLEQAVAALRHEKVLGFDIETPPTFRKGQVHNPTLVQLAGNDAVYLVQLRQVTNAERLASLLGDKQVVKTGVACGRDLIDLRRLFPVEAANVVDLGDIAKKQGITQTGLRNLAGMFFGGRITKGARTSNWAATDLTPAQIRYAATDAWVCRELYLHFEKQGWLP
jgi:ribonuclease D